MDLKQAVKTLLSSGLTQAEIVDRLGKKGVKASQATISRIGTGAFRSTNFELGVALTELAFAVVEQSSSTE